MEEISSLTVLLAVLLSSIAFWSLYSSKPSNVQADSGELQPGSREAFE